MSHGFNWFEWLIPGVNSFNSHIFAGLFSSLVLIVCALIYRLTLGSTSSEVVPDGRVSIKNMFQVATEGVLSLMEGVIGPEAKQYFPLIGATFIYIFVNNILGTIPGFSPATGNVNTNLACAIVVFVYYNYLGIKKQGFKNYMKHLMGPIWWIAPLLFSIELISHLARPLTLTIRLFGNLTGDHIVLGIFSELVPLVVPVLFMAFGIFVSFIQAFVFTLLSIVYIGLAVAHEEY